MLVRSENQWLYRDVTRQTKNCSVWSAFKLILPLWWWPTHLSRDNLGGSATDAFSWEGADSSMGIELELEITGASRPPMWQSHLNYPGSSAQAITIKATPAQRTSNGIILGLSGNVPIQPPVLGSNKHTPHEGESRDITTKILQHRHNIDYKPVQNINTTPT